MATATFQVVDEWANYIHVSGGANGPDVDGDTFKAALCLTAPTKAGTQVIGDITQITNAGGYAVVSLSNVTFTETGAGTGVWEFTCDPFHWTASGADFDTARYVVIYDDTASTPTKPVVGFADYGASFTLSDGATFTVTPGADGVYRTTVS